MANSITQNQINTLPPERTQRAEETINWLFQELKSIFLVGVQPLKPKRIISLLKKLGCVCWYEKKLRDLSWRMGFVKRKNRLINFYLA